MPGDVAAVLLVGIAIGAALKELTIRVDLAVARLLRSPRHRRRLRRRAEAHQRMSDEWLTRHATSEGNDR